MTSAADWISPATGTRFIPDGNSVSGNASGSHTIPQDPVAHEMVAVATVLFAIRSLG